MVVCSSEAHSSIASATEVMDVDIVAVPTGADGRLHGNAVAAALDEHGDAVFAVVVTGGTTNFGIVDDIASVAAVTKARDIWLHVDGAYGLAAMLVERMRPTFAGVELADSVIVDPHKWLFAPFDACALIYRDPSHGALRTLRKRSTSTPSPSGPTGTRPTSRSSSRAVRADYRCGSRSRPTAPTSTEPSIDHGIALAREIADEIERRDGLSLVRDPQLSVVVFRREGWGMAEYQAWSDRLLDDQIGFVVPSSHAGEPVLRFAIVNPTTTMELLTEILDTLA